MLMECAAMQELLGVKPVWWAAGSKEYPLSLQTLTALEFLLLGALELRRYQGWKATKQVHTLGMHSTDACVPTANFLGHTLLGSLLQLCIAARACQMHEWRAVLLVLPIHHFI